MAENLLNIVYSVIQTKTILCGFIPAVISSTGDSALLKDLIIFLEMILGNNLFKFFVLPILCLALCIIVKHLSKNDRFSNFHKEDLAVGLDLIVMVCLVYAIEGTNYLFEIRKKHNLLNELIENDQIIEANTILSDISNLENSIAFSLLIISAMFLSLGFVSNIVRKFGWKSATEMRASIGIIVPLIFGVGFLYLLMILLKA